MTFSEYDVVKSQYTVAEQFEDLRLYLCADRRCTDRVWQAPLSKQIEIQENKNFYLLALPKGENFTKEKYEMIKRMFEKYVKLEKEKEKLERIKKDFV